MAALVTVPFSFVVLSVGHSAFGQTTMNCTQGQHSGGDHDRKDDGEDGDDDDDDDDGEDDDPNDHCHNGGGNNGNGNGGGQGGGGNHNGGNNSSVAGSIAPTGSSAAAGIASTTSTSAGSGTGTAAAANTSSSGGHFNKASIAGIILGLICLMGLLALIFAYMRKRRRQKTEDWLNSKRDYEGARTYSNIGSDHGQDGMKETTAVGAGAAVAGASGAALLANEAHSHSQSSTIERDSVSTASSLPQSTVSVPLVLQPSHNYNSLSSNTSTQSLISQQPFSSISTPLYGFAYPNPVAGTSRSSHPPSSFPPTLSSTYPDSSPSSMTQSLINPYDEANLGLSGGRRASTASQRSSLHEDLVVHQKQMIMDHREMELSHSEGALPSTSDGVSPITFGPTPEPPPEYRPFSS